MLLPPIIGQEGGGLGLLTWLLPVLLCLMCASQSRGERAPPETTMTESWYTPQDIEAVYEAAVMEATEWRREAEEKASSSSESITSRLRRTLGGGKEEARFVVKEEIAPRLYRMVDKTGHIYFELTEVEDGGTVIKATYGSGIKSNIARFKANQPLKIPSIPVGKRCPTCGKPTLPEFSVCPYCGERLLKE